MRFAEHRPTYFDGVYLSEEDAQRGRALVAAERIIGNWALSKTRNAHMLLVNIAEKSTLTDLKVLRKIVSHFQTVVQPKIDVIPNEIGHQKNGRIQTIEHDDGYKSYSKKEALDHEMGLLITGAAKIGTISRKAAIAMSNDHPTSEGFVKPNPLRRNWLDLFSVEYADGRRKDMVPVVLAALDAMVEAFIMPVQGRQAA